MARNPSPQIIPQDHVLGPATARVTLLQYGDYECPVSHNIYRIVQDLLQAAEEDIRYVYRHFPLTKVHPHAREAAEAAEAAAQQDQFWPMHERLFDNQEQLDRNALIRCAEEVGLNIAQFETELVSGTHARRIRDDQRRGFENGVDTTSNLFINERRYRGEINRESVVHAIVMLTGLQLPELEEISVDGSSRARLRSVRSICKQTQPSDAEVLESVLNLAIEIAREGREGRKIGTLFTVGDAAAVLERSRPMVMDPLLGHPDAEKRIDLPDMRETIKELAQLDGGFVVGADGVVHSAARYFDSSSQGVELPRGLGSRHMAGASITLNTKAVAVVVSESSMVRLFRDGTVASEIVPELWMLRRYGLEPSQQGLEPEAVERSGEVAVVETS